MVMKHGAHFTLMTNIIVINNGMEDHTKTKSVQYRVSGSTHLISATVTCQICFNLNKNLKCETRLLLIGWYICGKFDVLRLR